MSKSLKRVEAALRAAGAEPDIREVGQARTAAEAAASAGVSVDQIVKSIIFRGEGTGHVVLFLTAGGNRVSAAKASAVAGQPLGKAEAEQIRAETGFAIGGVSPVGHLGPVQTFWDPRIDAFAEIWAAAGTPRHIFRSTPAELRQITGAIPADFTE